MSRPPRIPPQVFRIILLAVGIISCYFTARFFLTPASFGQYGWYRADALAEIASRERSYAGRNECDQCHSDETKKLLKDGHKTLSCEGCHGAGQAHADNPDVKLEVLSYSICLRCHEANSSRPKWHKQIVSKNHYTGAGKCTECHLPHVPADSP